MKIDQPIYMVRGCGTEDTILYIGTERPSPELIADLYEQYRELVHEADMVVIKMKDGEVCNFDDEMLIGDVIEVFEDPEKIDDDDDIDFEHEGDYLGNARTVVIKSIEELREERERRLQELEDKLMGI